MTSTEARPKLVEALQLDLVGPWPGHAFANNFCLKTRRAGISRATLCLKRHPWNNAPMSKPMRKSMQQVTVVEQTTAHRQRKKPWRYRWPDAIRDEVLARLLKLNAERAEQERLAGLAASPAKPIKKSSGAKPGRKPKADSTGLVPPQPDLLPPAQGDLFV